MSASNSCVYGCKDTVVQRLVKQPLCYIFSETILWLQHTKNRKYSSLLVARPWEPWQLWCCKWNFFIQSFRNVRTELLAAANAAHFYCGTRAIARGYTTWLRKTANLQMCMLTFRNACWCRCGPLRRHTLGPFSAGVDSHAASFPSQPTENDDGEALAGHATFTEKWLHPL